MTSQTDLDQSGTYRQMQKLWMGPSVGDIWVPSRAVLPITAAGTYTLARGMNSVQLSVAGNVTIQLPSSVPAPQGPMTLPESWATVPLFISDIAGLANAHTYTILPFGSELIGNIYNNTSVLLLLSAANGTYILTPNLNPTGGWSLSQS